MFMIRRNLADCQIYRPSNRADPGDTSFFTWMRGMFALFLPVARKLPYILFPAKSSIYATFVTLGINLQRIWLNGKLQRRETGANASC
jgi:hypothetical protein